MGEMRWEMRWDGRDERKRWDEREI